MTVGDVMHHLACSPAPFAIRTVEATGGQRGNSRFQLRGQRGDVGKPLRALARRGAVEFSDGVLLGVHAS